MYLLLNNLQHFHGAYFYADAAGNALSGGAAFLLDHNLHGADLYALAAGGTQLFINHINAGLGILSNGTGFADLSALAALDAGHRLSCAVLIHDFDAAQILVEFLVKSLGAGTDALQAGHTFNIFLNGKLLHLKRSPFQLFSFIIQKVHRNSKYKKYNFAVFCAFTGGNFLCIRREPGNTMLEPSKQEEQK